VASIVSIDATTCLFLYRVEGMTTPLPARVSFDVSRIGPTP
jgi:hypothetical protein